MSDWTEDRREIKRAKLAGNGEFYDALAGAKFERIEHPGEYCFLPWLRVTIWKHSGECVLEAPLTQVELIEFASRQHEESSR